MKHTAEQLQLPGVATSNGSEQLDIATHELAELDERLKTEGRFIAVLAVRRQGGYTVTIQKRRHNAIHTATPALLRGMAPQTGEGQE